MKDLCSVALWSHTLRIADLQAHYVVGRLFLRHAVKNESGFKMLVLPHPQLKAQHIVNGALQR